MGNDGWKVAREDSTSPQEAFSAITKGTAEQLACDLNRQDQSNIEIND